jgi:hypothetical protein
MVPVIGYEWMVCKASEIYILYDEIKEYMRFMYVGKVVENGTTYYKNRGRSNHHECTVRT